MESWPNVPFGLRHSIFEQKMIKCMVAGGVARIWLAGSLVGLNPTFMFIQRIAQISSLQVGCQLKITCAAMPSNGLSYSRWPSFCSLLVPAMGEISSPCISFAPLPLGMCVLHAGVFMHLLGARIGPKWLQQQGQNELILWVLGCMHPLVSPSNACFFQIFVCSPPPPCTPSFFGLLLQKAGILCVSVWRVTSARPFGSPWRRHFLVYTTSNRI